MLNLFHPLLWGIFGIHAKVKTKEGDGGGEGGSVKLNCPGGGVKGLRKNKNLEDKCICKRNITIL